MEQIPERDKKGRESKLNELNKAKAIEYDVDWPAADGTVSTRKFNYEQLNSTFTSLMAEKASLVAQRGLVDKPAKDAQTALNEFVKERLPGLSSADLAGLQHSVDAMDVKLRQIN